MSLLATILASAQAQTAAAVAARVTGAALMAAPPFGGPLPASVRAALIVALSMPAFALCKPALLASSGTALALALLGEALWGALLALPLRLAFEGLRLAGEAFATAALPGPSSSPSLLDGTRWSAAAHVPALAGLGATLALGGDRVALAGLMRSFAVLPPGSVLDAASVLSAAERLGTDYFLVAGTVLVPLVAVTLAVEAALAMAGRVSELGPDAFAGARALALLAALSFVVPAAVAPLAAGAAGAAAAQGGEAR